MKSRNKIRLGNGNMYHIVPHIQQSSMRKKPWPSILSLHPSSICVKPGCCSSTRGPELSTSFNTLKEDQSALSRKPAQIWGWHYPSLSLPDATYTVYVLYARIVLKQWHAILYIIYCTHWICVDIRMCMRTKQAKHKLSSEYVATQTGKARTHVARLPGNIPSLPNLPQ